MSLLRFFTLLTAVIALPCAASAQSIDRVWSNIELGEPITPAQICRSLNLPNIYQIERLHEISTITIRQKLHPVTCLSETWEEFIVDIQNLDGHCVALYYIQTSGQEGRLLNRYDTLKQQLDKTYFRGTESYSENATHISSLWEDRDTALRLILTRNPQKEQYTLQFSVSDKTPSEDFTKDRQSLLQR